MNHLFPPVAPARSSSLPWVLGLAALLIVAIGGYVAWNISTERSIDTSHMKLLETSIQEKSTMLADVQRVVASQAKTIDELHTDLQQRTN